MSINRQLLTINNNGNEMMAIDKTNIDAVFDDIVASTPNVKNNAPASTNIESNQLSLSFRNKDGILIQEFGDDVFVADNVLISEDQEEVSLKTSKY